jgi:hypothetical protein
LSGERARDQGGARGSKEEQGGAKRSKEGDEGKWRKEEEEGGRRKGMKESRGKRRKERKEEGYHAAAPAVPCTVAKIGTFDNEFQGNVSILRSRNPLVHSLIFIALRDR